MQCLPEEYSPYVFRVMEIGREPMLVELYEVICKAEDNLWIIADDKTNKHRAEDKENDKHVTGRTKGFIYELVTKKRKALPKFYYCQKPGHKIGKCFKYIFNSCLQYPILELREEDIPYSCDDYGTTSSSKNDEAEASSKT
ncbi:hypothetical protein Tco_0459677 [Tanacetum coccineum]